MHWWIVLALAATALADPLLFSNNMIHFPTRTVVKTESKQEPLKGWPIRESRPTHAHRPTYVPVHKGPHPIQHSHSKVDPIVAAQHLAKIGATLNIPAFQQIGGFMIGGADLFGGVTTLATTGFAVMPALAVGSALVTAVSSIVGLHDDDGQDDMGAMIAAGFTQLRSDLWSVRDALGEQMDERAKEIREQIDLVLVGLAESEQRAQFQSEERRGEHELLYETLLQGTSEILNRDVAILEARYDRATNWAHVDSNRFRRDLDDLYALLKVDSFSNIVSTTDLSWNWHYLAQHASALAELSSQDPWRSILRHAIITQPSVMSRAARLMFRMTVGAFWLVDAAQLERRVATLEQDLAPSLAFAARLASKETFLQLVHLAWDAHNETWTKFLSAFDQELFDAKRSAGETLMTNVTGISWDSLDGASHGNPVDRNWLHTRLPALGTSYGGNDGNLAYPHLLWDWTQTSIATELLVAHALKIGFLSAQWIAPTDGPLNGATSYAVDVNFYHGVSNVTRALRYTYTSDPDHRDKWVAALSENHEQQGIGISHMSWKSHYPAHYDQFYISQNATKLAANILASAVQVQHQKLANSTLQLLQKEKPASLLIDKMRADMFVSKLDRIGELAKAWFGANGTHFLSSNCSIFRKDKAIQMLTSIQSTATATSWSELREMITALQHESKLNECLTAAEDYFSFLTPHASSTLVKNAMEQLSMLPDSIRRLQILRKH